MRSSESQRKKDAGRSFRSKRQGEDPYPQETSLEGARGIAVNRLLRRSPPMPPAVEMVLGVTYLQLAFRLGQIGKVGPAQNVHHLTLRLFPDGVSRTDLVAAALTLGH